jgi:GMP synthase-like glutamine amidotransferase
VTLLPLELFKRIGTQCRPLLTSIQQLQHTMMHPGSPLSQTSAKVVHASPPLPNTQLSRPELYSSHLSIKIFGSCFGHQLLCHVLFSSAGKNIVCQDPKGYELGVKPITLSPSFLSHFGPVTSNPPHSDQLRLQFVHADHVDLPELPEGFYSIGSSQHCASQGIWKKGRVLTYQGHAEFDRFVNGAILVGQRRSC